MKPEQQYCFTHPSGEDIYLFTLRNSKGTEVLISNYGAIITSFKIKQADGKINDIVLGFEKLEDYFSEEYLKDYPWFGSAVGRYANRIKDAAIEIDGKKYQLSKNIGSDQLHGGISGFDKKVWQTVAFTDDPYAILELRYTSPDGEEGYPGNLDVTIRFELNNADELSYEYSATCDQATAVNLTHHSYFNLNNGEGNIADHSVKIYASHILEQDTNLVANGNYIEVRGTGYDFYQWEKINKNWIQEDGYDQSYVIDRKDDKVSLVAEAFSEKTKIKLQVWSTEPVVHFYTGKWIPKVKGKNNHLYGLFSGFCFETHIHPNAINIPHFPNTILRPGEKYYQKTVYKIFHTDVK